MFWDIVFIVVSFLLGSIPFGKIIASAKGIDITKEGSGNIGATNVFRVVGKFWGLVVLILDALKGILPTLFVKWLYTGSVVSFYLPEPYVFVGVFAILGHMFSPFVAFRGGKGVATSLGVFLVLTPFGVVLGVVVFSLFLLIFRIVSISSMAAAISVFAYVLVDSIYSSNISQNYVLVITTFIVMLLVIIRHIPNIKRIIKGEEKKVF
ncbi:MAG: glycerol-3-phosphate 1-O-acyltransferase PlsY [Brevinematia bacterium]